MSNSFINVKIFKSSCFLYLDQIGFDLLRSVYREHLVIVIGIKEHIIDVLLAGCTGNDSTTAFTIDCVVSKKNINIYFIISPFE